MFVILAYDVASKRTGRVMKIAKKYLNARQRSVFEGFITEGQLKALKKEIAEVIEPEKDSVIMYKLYSSKYILRDEIGKSDKRESYFL